MCIGQRWGWVVSDALSCTMGQSYSPSLYESSFGSDDCDDTNPAVHNFAIEVADGIDNNCKRRALLSLYARARMYSHRFCHKFVFQVMDKPLTAIL